jgi:phosphatidylserine decarboxylase
MYIPITKYGLPQVLVYPAVTLALMAALYIFLPKGAALAAAEAVLFAVFVWMLMFFRDPRREIPLDETALLSPADGTITDISETEVPELGGRALRIGMFLSIFNVHINRMPCSVRVESIQYKKGKFKNAMSPESGRVNESNDILAVRLSGSGDKLLVRQVSGAIARHIVCEAREASEYRQGEPFGMIKFGSRTELYLPLGEGKLQEGVFTNGSFEVTVKIGDKVRAGLTPLVRYQER